MKSHKKMVVNPHLFSGMRGNSVFLMKEHFDNDDMDVDVDVSDIDTSTSTSTSTINIDTNEIDIPIHLQSPESESNSNSMTETETAKPDFIDNLKQNANYAMEKMKQMIRS
jgi:hypothetical protein